MSQWRLFAESIHYLRSSSHWVQYLFVVPCGHRFYQNYCIRSTEIDQKDPFHVSLELGYKEALNIVSSEKQRLQVDWVMMFKLVHIIADLSYANIIYEAFNLILTFVTPFLKYSSLVVILLFVQHFSVLDAYMHGMLYNRSFVQKYLKLCDLSSFLIVFSWTGLCSSLYRISVILCQCVGNRIMFC